MAAERRCPAFAGGSALRCAVGGAEGPGVWCELLWLPDAFWRLPERSGHKSGVVGMEKKGTNFVKNLSSLQMIWLQIFIIRTFKTIC